MQIEHITLVRTPQGTPTEADFAFGSGTLPAHAEGQALVRVLALSLDPYLRSAMAGRHLSAAIHPGDVVRGEGLVQVLESRHPRLTPGTQWVAQCGWRSHALLGVEAIEQARRVGPEVQPPTLALGALGMPGLTAWAGFKRLADAKPGDTLVVSAASGPVGATVGQLARLAGCRVIGIAGGPEKCAWVTRRAGFDACIDYRAEDLREALRRHAPDGVDIYFDNVGGDVLLAVCEQLAVGCARRAVRADGAVQRRGAGAAEPGADHPRPCHRSWPGGLRPLGPLRRDGGRDWRLHPRRATAVPRRHQPWPGQHSVGVCPADGRPQPGQGAGCAVKPQLESSTMFKRFTLTALVMFAALPVARAEPVSAAERIPVDIRRTTFVVRDIEKSLPLYRDALGLKLIYDTPIGGGVDKDGKAVAVSVRLVLLRANDSFIGNLGLMQRLNQPPAPPPEFKKAGVGQMIMVINVADLDERWPKIAATPHIKVETAPIRVEYPNPAGGVIPVLFSAVWDADGNYIELNKLLGAPAGTAAKAPAAATPAK
jgi:NADPH-dependent curcumin reductase CurA/catechol 2,3-dioxygenase-like lactoylglutathione lyase family enzyme